MNLNEEFEKLYRDSPVEVQRQYDRLQENREKARELADMLGDVAVDELLHGSNITVSVELLELTAQLLVEDCKRIREYAADILREKEAVNEERYGEKADTDRG